MSLLTNIIIVKMTKLTIKHYKKTSCDSNFKWVRCMCLCSMIGRVDEREEDMWGENVAEQKRGKI